jgi:hypothetical protein
LLFQLLTAQFGLAVFELGAVLVGLGNTISNWNVEIESRTLLVGQGESILTDQFLINASAFSEARPW